MEKYCVPRKLSPENPRPNPRYRAWRRSLIELEGRLDRKYRHCLSSLLMESYDEFGAFSHLYHVDGRPCRTHADLVNDSSNLGQQSPFKMRGISCVEFDNKGIYIVAVTKSGCLSVYDFETLYCQSNHIFPSLKEDEHKHILHLSLQQKLDVVRWNIANQDEVACASMKSNEVLIFDIGYISSKPTQVLRTKPSLSVLGSNTFRGLCDITFSSNDDSRLLASDTHGGVYMWDRRTSFLPCLELTTGSSGSLNSIQLDMENQTVICAGTEGVIYIWDLRGGRNSAAFQCHREVAFRPLTSLKLSSLLGKITSLKAQSDIVSTEIHSVNLNPACPYQLAFHLADGWSGVLDMYTLKVTHVHCPPPAWLNGSSISADLLCLRKPSWMPSLSMYVVGSASENGIHILDFYPDPSSPSHVDYCEDSEARHQMKQNRFVPLREGVTACTSHPHNGTIVAGTKNSSMLMVSQRHQSF